MSGIECIRVFPDRPDSDPPFVGHKHLEFGSDEYKRFIERSQERGAGIYFSVNGTDGRGAKAENIVQVRTYYVDIDGLEDKRPALEKLITAKLKPSAIVETKNGVHAYWYAKQQTPVDHSLYKLVQKGLIQEFGGDRSAKDISRVLRVPNTWHLKGEPFLCRIVHQLPEHLTPYYKASDLLEVYPYPEEKPLTRVKVHRSPGRWSRFVEDLERWDPVPGERNQVMLLCAGVAIAFGVDKEDYIDTMLPVVDTWNTGRNVEAELRRVADWAYSRGNPIPAFVLRKRGVPIRRGL